ncbi:MAG TPA: ABC transporter ATP-binding protein [Methylomusa anaerophila]|uniref:Lipoprotein-releasing system ATP-binding protein LolD n=1 Tax=Methylomusa anaerophila TaxID=1930071 RepID=A0A348AGT0_9FIRM|nr:ABC transporter ATP-binding protein [Methylomusa anaerophila]BBB90278.1 lipoprotein-releasing system ATP-binding protein LolD [Methylomusa anaerophila]HML89377.1 ABC transporter ATP-binding protein [Methylomusa anaerophila]
MLEIHNLVKQFRHPNGEMITVTAVDQLRIGQGEQLILAGPSGSGKTTLLHLIAGLISPTAGEILWDEERIDHLPEARRDAWRAHNVGYIFQNFNLLNSLSVLENILVAVAFGSRSSSQGRRNEILPLLTKVGLADRADDKPARLSTGEQQRVAVARALINKPRLILADEPTASLDQGNVKVVLELLQELCEQNHSTLVLATHDREVMSRFPRILEMRRQGRELP